jgi:[ribosomal protein S5]-alanine N-acetyltransferase
MHQVIGKYILRDWQLDDAPSIAQYADNHKIWQHLRDGFPHPYHLHDAEVFIERVNQAIPKAVFAIATESEAIGSIGLMLGEDVHRFTAEMGYWLAEPFWGQGIMTQAVRFLVKWAFRELKLHRISAEPYATNRASHRVLEKAGFSHEGILRSSALKDGKILDQFLYSRIANVKAQSVVAGAEKKQTSSSALAHSDASQMIRKMDHVNIVVNDLERASEFFTRLGFSVEHRGELEGEWIASIVNLKAVRASYVQLSLKGSGVKLELIKYHRPESCGGVGTNLPNEIGIRHIAFEVEDIEAVVTSLKAAGIDFWGDVQTYPETGKKLVYFYGPDDVILELAEYPPK